MELMTLDPTTLKPVDLVEKFESLVWTERYSSSGDFVLTTPDIEKTINLLPLESLVTLRETTVPMVVEIHQIKKPIRGVPMLEVRGRSCETWLERRASLILALGAYTSLEIQQLAAGKSSDAAYKAIRAVIGDIDRGVLSAISPAASALDAIPQVNLPLPADYDSTDPDWVNFEIPRGNLYSVVLDLLAQNHHGIKAVRPFDDVDTKIDLEIYNGADLTDTIMFDAHFDQFDDATYLFSYQGSANIDYIFGANGSERIRKNEAGDEVSGLTRRVILQDEAGDADLDSSEKRKSRALIELYKYNATALFDGQTSEQVASGFNVDYFLGDILKLNGEYGVSANVRVAEFIRSDEPSGTRAYPAFEVVE